MVAPVTGPFVSLIDRKGPPTSLGYRPLIFSQRKTAYRQKPPYNLKLAYDMTRYTASYGGTDPAFYANATFNADGVGYGDTNLAEAQAYNRFKQEAYESASLGVTLAERRQAMSMITARITQLYRFSRYLRRFQFRRALETINPIQHPKEEGWRPKSRIYGSMWLEYHFGWEPLVKDIQSTMKVLDSPFPYGAVKGSGKSTKSSTVVTQNTNTDFVYARLVTNFNTRYQVKYGGRIEVVNPNLHLADSLGLINPAILVWELIPFSFVVDWFTGVGNYLQSFTDFAGCRIVDPWSVKMYYGQETMTYVGRNYQINTITGAKELASSANRSSIRTYRRMIRGTSTPVLPRPSFSLPDRISPIRGITAVSLLLQQLKGR